MKRVLILTLVLLFAVQTVGFAAKSGSSIRMTPSRPSTMQKAAPPPAGNYKPSAPASSYSEKAPAAKTASPQTAAQPATGGFMRNFGLFGGGMLLGGLLGNMFGFGHGLFANMLGIIFNIMLLAGIFMAGRYIWGKLTSRDRRR